MLRPKGAWGPSTPDFLTRQTANVCTIFAPSGSFPATAIFLLVAVAACYFLWVLIGAGLGYWNRALAFGIGCGIRRYLFGQVTGRDAARVVAG